MRIRHTDYSNKHQDQALAELVAPKLIDDVHELIDDILERFADSHKLELQYDGWTPPA